MNYGIDYNSQEQLKEIKAIKNHPNFELFVKYVENEIDKLSELDTIQDEADLQARKLAIKTIRKIILFINN